MTSRRHEEPTRDVGQAASGSAPRDAGTRSGSPGAVGPYAILGELGRGGMGTVWLARDTRLGRTVALKSLPATLARHAPSRSRATREAQALAAVNHPHVATLHGLEEHEGDLYLVLEHVQGRSLAERLGDAGALDVDEALGIGLQVASALEEVHAQGILHRDLKPSNVLVTDGGIAKLVDFGIAVSAAAAVADAGDGAILGTPGYLSPEALQGDAAGRPAEAWSFGCLLLSCLTGRAPFPTEGSVGDMLEAARRGPDWSALPRETPPRVRQLLERCLEIEPARRLSDMTEIRLELERSLARLEWRPRPGASAPGRAQRQNLPHPPTAFVGRERELAELARRTTASRLVTLTGLGGVGKTRLALQTAWSTLGSWPDGAWLVELGAALDQARVPVVVAEALGVTDRPGAEPVDRLVEILASRHLLLVLDGCEEVRDGSARLVESLLARCPQLSVLATSRAALGIAGEDTMAVPPLGVPAAAAEITLEEARASEAFRLFERRLVEAGPAGTLADGELAAAVRACRRLDGIPLALELVAARAAATSVERAVAELDEWLDAREGAGAGLPRPSALRAALDWGHEALTDGERRVFRRLAIFRGAFTAGAAARVCGLTEGESDDVADVLTRLVERSLVMPPDRHGRTRLLSAVRQRAAEALEAAGEGDELERRHRRFYLARAERAAPRLRGADQAWWLERIAAEEPDLDAALDAAERDPAARPDQLRLAAALGTFWHLRGRAHEGRRRLEAALARDRRAGTTLAMAEALHWAGVFAWLQGDLDTARRRHEESRAASERLGDSRGVALSINNLGNVASVSGRHDEALGLYREALESYRKAGDPSGEASTLGNVGAALFCLGRPEEARPYLEDAIAAGRQVGHPRAVTTGLGMLAHVERSLGRRERARELAGEALALNRAAGDRQGTARELNNVATYARDDGDLEAARAHLTASVHLHEELGDRLGESQALANLADVLLCLDERPAASRALRRCLVLRRHVGHPALVADALLRLVDVIAQEGHSRIAARVLGALEDVASADEPVAEPVPRATRDDLLQRLARELEADDLARELAAGRALDLTQACELVERT